MGEPQQDSEPLDIEVFLPRSVDLIDSRLQDQRRDFSELERRFNSRKRLALLLFIATCLSTFYVGMLGTDPETMTGVSDLLRNGLYYSGPLMLILLFHEMGHYLQARRYRVPASPPFFIPMPIGPFGTMGAVIVQGAGIANRKQMFDIAITGPLAGLVMALPFAYFGLQMSQVIVITDPSKYMEFGDPLILQWMNRLVFPNLGPQEAVLQSPMAFAGWVGIFITALNLIPIGQLDGGHILYTLIGKRAHVVAITLLWATVGFMLLTANYSYVLIVLLLLVFGPRHPPTADDRVPLGMPRVILGWLTMSFIVIGFTPTPIISLPGGQRNVPARQSDEGKQPAREPVDPDELVLSGIHPQIVQISPIEIQAGFPRVSPSPRPRAASSPLDVSLHKC